MSLTFGPFHNLNIPHNPSLNELPFDFQESLVKHRMSLPFSLHGLEEFKKKEEKKNRRIKEARTKNNKNMQSDIDTLDFPLKKSPVELKSGSGSGLGLGSVSDSGMLDLSMLESESDVDAYSLFTALPTTLWPSPSLPSSLPSTSSSVSSASSSSASSALSVLAVPKAVEDAVMSNRYIDQRDVERLLINFSEPFAPLRGIKLAMICTRTNKKKIKFSTLCNFLSYFGAATTTSQTKSTKTKKMHIRIEKPQKDHQADKKGQNPTVKQIEGEYKEKEKDKDKDIDKDKDKETNQINTTTTINAGTGYADTNGNELFTDDRLYRGLVKLTTDLSIDDSNEYSHLCKNWFFGYTNSEEARNLLTGSLQTEKMYRTLNFLVRVTSDGKLDLHYISYPTVLVSDSDWQDEDQDQDQDRDLNQKWHKRQLKEATVEQKRIHFRLKPVVNNSPFSSNPTSSLVMYPYGKLPLGSISGSSGSSDVSSDASSDVSGANSASGGSNTNVVPVYFVQLNRDQYQSGTNNDKEAKAGDDQGLDSPTPTSPTSLRIISARSLTRLIGKLQKKGIIHANTFSVDSTMFSKQVHEEFITLQPELDRQRQDGYKANALKTLAQRFKIAEDIQTKKAALGKERQKQIQLQERQERDRFTAYVIKNAGSGGSGGVSGGVVNNKDAIDSMDNMDIMDTMAMAGMNCERCGASTAGSLLCGGTKCWNS